MSVTAPDDSILLQGLKVLVVDDSEDNRFLISRMLTKRGAEVHVAENGAAGVERALSEDFSIVLMDINMPEMDGYTATQKLREAGYDKPVIALTAHATLEARQLGIEAGCSDHVTKPIGAIELTGKIARWTKN